MTIDRALSGDPFAIDHFRCRDAALVLREFKPHVRPEPWSTLPAASQFTFKALFISICHQFNWDFLQNAMARLLLPHPEKRLHEIERVRASDIQKALAHYPKQERVQAKQRARILRETASELRALIERGELQRLMRVRRLEGHQGFYEVMRGISAFAEDELEKKLRVLAHDLYRESIVRFRDPANLRPAVEYHILRLYIRSGRVYPTHRSVKEQLLLPATPARARLVKLLRRAVEEAMTQTAFYAGLDIATLNYVEWQVGRAICIAERPRCVRVPKKELPQDVAAIVDGKQCPYAAFCSSRNDPKYGWYYEPHFQKAIY